MNLKENKRLNECAVIRNRIEKLLHVSFGVGHVTLQLEYEGCSEDGLIRSDSQTKEMAKC